MKILEIARLLDCLFETRLITRLICWSEQEGVSLWVDDGLIEGQHEFPIESEWVIKRNIGTGKFWLQCPANGADQVTPFIVLVVSCSISQLFWKHLFPFLLRIGRRELSS